MTDAERYARLTAELAELAAEMARVTAERDGLLAELEKIKGAKRDRQARWRAKQATSTVTSTAELTETSQPEEETSQQEEAAARDVSNDVTSVECDVSSRADLSLIPTSLPNPLSKENLCSNQHSYSWTPSPQSGTELAPASDFGDFAGLMDITTMVNGHPATRPAPPPPDYETRYINPEIGALVDAVLGEVINGKLLRQLKERTTSDVRGYSMEQIAKGLIWWYERDEKLYAGNIMFCVANAQRGEPLSSKEVKQRTLQGKKIQPGVRMTAQKEIRS